MISEIVTIYEQIIIILEEIGSEMVFYFTLRRKCAYSTCLRSVLGVAYFKGEVMGML
jgi:hypothetical protein